MARKRTEEEIDSDDEASDSDHEAESIAIDKDDQDSDDDPEDDPNPDSPRSSKKKPKKKKPATLLERIANNPLGKQVVSLVTGVEFLLGALTSFRNFVQSCRAFVREKKEPKETYKQRRRQKAWICVKDFAAFIGHTAFVVVTVAGVIAAVANPFGLAISMGMLGSIAAAAFGVVTASILLDKFANKKMKAIDKSLRKTKGEHHDRGYHHNRYDGRQSQSLKARFKELHELGKKKGEAFLEMADAYEANPHKNPALLLMKHATDNHPGLLLKVEHRLVHDAYKQIADSTLQRLARIKDDQNLIYQNIQVSHGMSSDPQALLVKVPRTTEGTDGVKEDHIRRFKDHKGIQIHMNADPSDAALSLMMATVAQGLGPLKMRPGASVANILRALEAAKLSTPEVTLKIDLKDRARIEQASHQTGDYFRALMHVSAQQFKDYVAEEVEKYGERRLGKIPDEIPSSWTQRPRNTR